MIMNTYKIIIWRYSPFSMPQVDEIIIECDEKTLEREIERLNNSWYAHVIDYECLGGVH